MAKAKKVENCPKCGEEFDPNEDQIIECPRCGIEGSTKCCNIGGRNCICVSCEEEEANPDEMEE